MIYGYSLNFIKSNFFTIFSNFGFWKPYCPKTSTIIGYTSLMAVMVTTGVILCLTVVAEGWLNEKVTMVFSRITAIILAGLSVQYVIDGLVSVGLIAQ